MLFADASSVLDTFMPAFSTINTYSDGITNSVSTVETNKPKIILVDFIESNVAQGQELRQAVAEAGRVRMRPIILTTLTTIGGLLPLSLFGGALFSPMTNGMIFGLLVSTVLTLFVIPSLYVLMVEKAGMKVSRTEEASAKSIQNPV